jgi:hypothetical protein
MRLRRSRYCGLKKTHLQHIGTAAAINLVRAIAWVGGDELAPTRVSAFQRLYAAAQGFPNSVKSAQEPLRGGKVK